jgi:hypothetical protein
LDQEKSGNPSQCDLSRLRVDFNDELLTDQTATKKWLLKQHTATLPWHVFDGSMIFSTQRLFPVGIFLILIFLLPKISWILYPTNEDAASGQIWPFATYYARSITL